MACECCNSAEKREAMISDFGKEIQYCPICGESLIVMEFIDEIRNPIETVQIDGKTLVVDRKRQSFDIDRMVWGNLDLDSINIDKELEFLGLKKGE